MESEIGKAGVDIGEIIDRTKKIFLNPKGAWEQIRAERYTVQELYQRYVLVMAAIPVVCGFIGMVVFGISVPFVGTFRPPFFSSLVGGIVNYIVQLVMLFATGFIVSKVAEMCEAKPTLEDALKLCAFAAFPAYAAGVFSIYPMLAILGGLVSLYSIYVFWVGITPILGVPEGSRIKLCVVSFIGILITAIVLGIATSKFQPTPPMTVDNPLLSEELETKLKDLDPKEIEKSVEHFKRAFQQKDGE